MAIPVGIDLGTSTSEIAVFRNGTPELLDDIRNSDGGILPSVVAKGPMGDLVVGKSARNMALAVRAVKRDMGTDKRISLGDKEYLPQEISARILRHLKENAERILGEEVSEAVITVPAAFKDRQRQATIDAGELAGLRVERIVNEPTAAALSYGLHNLNDEQHVLVFDLGGGTFDVSVLEMFEGVFEVKASAGDDHLGGRDFDAAIANLIYGEIERQHNISKAELNSDRAAVDEIERKSEEAKVELSSQDATMIDIPYLGKRSVGFQMLLNRREFEIATRRLVQRTGESIERALTDAGLEKEQVDEVILVGGATRIPAVREFVSQYFDGRALPERVPPDKAVALGAAVQAALKSGEIDPASGGMIVTDVTQHSLGVATLMMEGGMLIPDRMAVHIPRQTTVPVEKTERYHTVHEGQTAVKIRVYQGESQDVSKNTLLDQIELNGIPGGPAGQEALDISFALDPNQTLTVKATIVSTGHAAEKTIAPSRARMSEEEKKSAAASLEDEWRQSAFYQRVAPLIEAAERKLASVEDPDATAKVRDVVERLKAVLKTEDESEVDRLDRELTDLLFELE